MARRNSHPKSYLQVFQWEKIIRERRFKKNAHSLDTNPKVANIVRMWYGREPNTLAEKILFWFAWVAVLIGFTWLTWYFFRGKKHERKESPIRTFSGVSAVEFQLRTPTRSGKPQFRRMDFDLS